MAAAFDIPSWYIVSKEVAFFIRKVAFHFNNLSFQSGLGMNIGSCTRRHCNVPTYNITHCDILIPLLSRK